MESVVERAKAWLKMCDDVDAGRAYSCDIIRELLAVVEMYPKTVDGAPVWPGMVVYDKRARPLDGDPAGMYQIGSVSGGRGWSWNALRNSVWPLYSTRAAAESARKDKP